MHLQEQNSLLLAHRQNVANLCIRITKYINVKYWCTPNNYDSVLFISQHIKLATVCYTLNFLMKAYLITPIIILFSPKLPLVPHLLPLYQVQTTTWPKHPGTKNTEHPEMQCATVQSASTTIHDNKTLQLQHLYSLEDLVLP